MTDERSSGARVRPDGAGRAAGAAARTDKHWALSGFGDEVDDDPEVQTSVLAALGARHIEVRAAWGTNVVELDDDALDRLAGVLERRGFGVSAIASPIGKTDVGLPVEHEVQRLTRAIAAAQRLRAPYIRIFSFYHEGRTPEAVRDGVLQRLRALTEVAEREGVTLLHENEKEIYGDTPERVLDVIESIGSERLRVAWDSANFVQVGVRPFTDGWPTLRPHLEYLQVKDAVAATGEVVPAGEGDGQLRETIGALASDGYSGFASLEPHLAKAGALGGFSGPAEFGRAGRALRALTDEAGVELA